MAGPTSSRETIGDVGEFGFLADLLPRFRPGAGVVVGPGQDCAVVRSGTCKLLVTVDSLVENVHFRSGWMSSHQLGRRSFLVNASDIAAMGGRPRWCLVSIVAPRRYSRRALDEIHRGIDDAAAEAGAAIVGGNMAAGTQLCVSVTVIGIAPHRIVTRAGARVGDCVYVTGTLGDAALGVRCLRRHRRNAAAIARYREPTPRLTAGQLLVRSGAVSAMIDVSDGLVQDLHHLCHESGVGAEVDAQRLPLSKAVRSSADRLRLAVAGGENYELLCTVPRRKEALLERLRSQLDCPITAIGRITSERTVRVLNPASNLSSLKGYDHFANG